MQSKHSMINKSVISKYTTLLIMSFVVMFTALLLHHPSTVRATSAEGNATQYTVDFDLISEGSSDMAKKVFTNDRYANGWLMYLADSSGALKSKVVLMSGVGTIKSSAWLYTRYGHVAPMASFDSPWTPKAPFNFDGGQVAHGEEVKNWLLQPCEVDGMTLYNAHKVIFDKLGTDAFELFCNEWEDTYLILDVVFRTPFVISYSKELHRASVYDMCATIPGFAKGSSVIDDYGQSLLLKQNTPDLFDIFDSSWLTNRAAPLSAYLDKDWKGLAKAPTLNLDYLGRVSRSDMDAFGYGEIAIRGKEPEGIHTFNGHDSPGDPEDPNDYDPPHDGKSRMVKVYYTADENTGAVLSEDGYFSKIDVSPLIYIDDEPEYDIVKWKASSNTTTSGITSVNWEAASGTALHSGTGPDSIELDETKNENTVYVLLRKVEGEDPEDLTVDYTLTQSEVTKRVKLSKAHTTSKRIHNKKFRWLTPAHTTSCPGHTVTITTEIDCPEDHDATHAEAGCTTPNCQEKHKKSCGKKHKVTSTKTEKCKGWGWKEKALTLGLKYSISQGSDPLVATANAFKSELTKKQEGYTVTKRIITCNATKTKSYVPSSVDKQKNWDYIFVIMRGKDKLKTAKWKNKGTTDLAQIGFQQSNTDTGGRKTEDYTDNFQLTISDDSSDRVSTYGPTTAVSDGQICADSVRVANLVNPLSSAIDIGVKVKCFSGKGEGSSPVLETGSIGYGAARKNGYVVSFKPYIQMQYDTRSSNVEKGSRNIAYVLGTHPKSLNVYDYATVKFTPAGSANLDINSAQWSMHKQAVEDTSNGKVLPGGAAYDVSAKGGTGTKQTFTIDTYQVLLKQGSDGYKQVNKTNGSVPSGICTTEAEARNRHMQLHNQVKNILQSAYMEQLVAKGKDSNPLSSGFVVTNGSDINALANGSSQASSDSKYYLIQSTGINGNMFNVSDTAASGGVSGSISAKPDTSGLDVTGNLFDSYTNVKTAVTEALERGTGSDSRSSWGSAWYNEAFDGISVVHYTSKVSVGLWNSPTRSTLLDPKLIPKGSKGNSQSDLFTDYNTTQYRTHGIDTLGSWGFPIKISRVSFEKLFWSDKFYIPNVTVQDLH